MEYFISQPIAQKCCQLQQATTTQSERNLGVRYPQKPRRQSYKVQNQSMSQHLRIETSNASISTAHDKLGSDSCVKLNPEFSIGSKRCPPDHRHLIIRDEDAAAQVERYILRRKHRLTNRIFRNLVTRRDKLDNDSIDDLLVAADKTIFGGSLSGRVCWEWSKGQPEYDHELLGTTALRRTGSSGDGIETQIILSKPLLQDKRFTRDLLLSTILHELIHSYLFIRCGLQHAKGDGHTRGFQKIAQLIDRYFGHGRLHLCNMQANLRHFLASTSTTSEGSHSLNWRQPCFESPHRSEVPCSHFVDEGYWSRDSSPGSSGSPQIPDYYVIAKTGLEGAESESHRACDMERLQNQR